MLKLPITDSGRVVSRPATGPRDADMLPPDYLSVASVLFAFAATYVNMRVLGWAAFFSLLSSLLTRSKSEFDKIQTIISGIVTVVVLSLVYADPYSS
jgi:hypothetical protein